MPKTSLQEKHRVVYLVSNLPGKADPEAIRNLFTLFGRVYDVSLSQDASLPVATVTMSSRTLSRDVSLPEGLTLKNKVLEISVAEESNSRPFVTKAKAKKKTALKKSSGKR